MALLLSLDHLTFRGCGARAALAEPPPLPDYRWWEDVYRQQWAWDKVVRSSHFVNCWYQAHCAWDVFVKDGLVWREEQAADYPAVRSDTPDFNPRGCQKGACYSARMYDPTRVKYPLKRVGERGAGRWQRLSWEQALNEIADLMIDTITQEGTDRIVWSLGPLYTFGTQAAGHSRLSFLLDSSSLDMNTEIGDGHPGAAVTFGKIVAERSLDDYFFSDVILVWGCNPLCTQIPNAHFWTEARYKGAYIVAISPDYNASAIHADQWVALNVGTDAAFALSLAQVIVGEKLHHEAFLREQTDMPFLVRSDTGRFLRQSDLVEGGASDVLYVFDEQRKTIVEAPRDTLSLGALVPALDGTYDAQMRTGRVKVRPVFALLRERLDRDYAPEQTAATTGISATVVRDLARRIGRAKAVSNVTSSNIAKFYHGNLMERAQILVFALCGHMGKKGSGFSAFPFLTQDGVETFALLRRPGWMGKIGLLAHAYPLLSELKKPGMTDEMLRYEVGNWQFRQGSFVSGVMFWNVHGGLLALSGRSKEWDPYLKRPVSEYLHEALEKGYQYVSPKPDTPPRIIFELGSNIVRRLRGYPVLFTSLFPKLKAYVTIDWRMSSTALASDYVLPAAGWYEKAEHKWGTPLMPYIHAGSKIASYQEAKPDWEVCALLAKAVQERAKARGITTFRDRHGNERPLDTLYDDFTMGGTYTEHDDEKVAAELVKQASNLSGIDWEQLKRKGYARFTGIGNAGVSVGNQCDVKPDDTVSPFQYHVEQKAPYPTLSRRIQFYIDHPFYLELGETLPTHKAPPTAGGNYPLTLTGGHTRWSIHAAWRDDARMLRLQRGEPLMYLSVADAQARGISDGELVEVHNDIDRFRIRAKTSPAVRPGQVIIYHAWENYQFVDGKGFQNLIPSPINPIELAGGEGHLRPIQICLQPGQNDRDTRVDVRRIAV
ncbi:MAG TPA: molybdopterin-dependent oxidoreductase [Candidatus Dormibacteraeota bacterium]|nr:molybdopterin-dependent oxidoreductase [Candidatus Dormibacteraeota bacterium]